MADIKLQASRLLSKQRTFPRADSCTIKGIAGPDKDGSVYAIVDYQENDENANSDVADRVLKLDMKNRRIQWLHKVTGSLTNWEEIVGSNGRGGYPNGHCSSKQSGSDFVVSGDGTKLYFLTTDMEIEENKDEKPVRTTLYEYDTITGIERSVAHVPDFFRYGFFVSPDGSKLLVPHHSDEQGNSVGQVYDLKNGKVHSLASSNSHWDWRTSMCFSNDGNRIVITRRDTSDDTYEAAMVFNANTGRPLFSEDKVIHRGSEAQVEGGISASCVAPIPGGYLFAFSDGFVKTDENLNQVEYMPLDGKDQIKNRAPWFFMLDAQCRFGLVAWDKNYCYVDFEEHTYCDDIHTFGSDDNLGDKVILFSRDGSKLYSDYQDDWLSDDDTVWEVPLSGLPMKPFAAPKPAEPEFDWSMFF